MIYPTNTECIKNSNELFTIYGFEVEKYKNSSHIINKRFSDFVKLNNNLKLQKIKLPKLPSKTFTKKFNKIFIENRHKSLLLYLKQLILIKQLKSNKLLLKFLQIQNIENNQLINNISKTLVVLIYNEEYFGDNKSKYKAPNICGTIIINICKEI